LNSTVQAYQDSLNLTRVLNKTGIDSDQDVAQAETLLATTEAQATNLGIQRAQMEHAIALLIGRPASDFFIASNSFAVKPVAIPFGVPSQLLERRPDIAAAERTVAAANAQIGVARAAYFPTITLSGSVGYQNNNLDELVTPNSWIWSIGGTLAETVFDAGRRRAVTAQAWASYHATVADYRETVLAAFQEVEDNLVSLRILTQELQQQEEAVAASQRYLNLALTRYRLGVDSYLNVITAQTAALNTQVTALNLRLEQMIASVQLIADLGGGWEINNNTVDNDGHSLSTSH
jgi:NodT family efflux transporter outer membrane factor (OMF) lipoprotein